MSAGAGQFRDVRASDLRSIRRLTGQLMEAEDLPTLGQELINGAEKFLPSDFMLWNVWLPDMSRIIGLASNQRDCCDLLGRYETAVRATIHHQNLETGFGQFPRHHRSSKARAHYHHVMLRHRRRPTGRRHHRLDRAVRRALDGNQRRHGQRGA